MTREQVIDIIADTVKLARKHTDNVEWSAMDATRSDLDYLSQAVETAIAAGATTSTYPTQSVTVHQNPSPPCSNM